ncbi:MAG: translation initiation factor, partial [Acidobacteria bacterium]
GGTASGGTVEIQGDHRDRLRQLLAGKPGWTVKG